MKKSVGMITIHYVDNLGGVLLAYALQETVDRFGYDCHVIDYDPTIVPSVGRHLVRTISRRVARIPEYLLNIPHYFKMLIRERGAIVPSRHIHKSTGLRKIRFDTFRQKYIKLGERHYDSSETLDSDPPRYDAYVCGSDQIWNPYICKNPDQARNEPAYFLTFAPEAKRISYAPSIAIPSIPEQFRAEMAQMLCGIPYLSSREKQGAVLIKELAGREAEVVLDPTLLLNCDQWSSIAAGPEIQGPYILCYFLGDGQEGRHFAERLSKETGHRLVVISQQSRDLEGPNTINCSDSGPAEFLGLIKSASCVCTDSYHGTILSINFKRPFYVFERSGSSGTQSMVSRIYSILDLLELTPRMMKTAMPPPGVPLPMDYTKTDSLLRKHREASLHYLESALRQAASS
jgi:hypothetical protein